MSGPAMIIPALILILTGSFGGAIALWLLGGSFWGIALGYVGGGWAGLLGGALLMLIARAVAGLPLRLSSAKKRSRRHQ